MPPRLNRHPLLVLKEAIMGQGLAHFHDLDVFVLHLPKLAFGKRNHGELFGLHIIE